MEQTARGNCSAKLFLFWLFAIALPERRQRSEIGLLKFFFILAVSPLPKE